MRVSTLTLLALFQMAALSWGCHSTKRPHTLPWDALSNTAKRHRLLMDATDFRHKQRFDVERERFPSDCSGYIDAVLYLNGIDVLAGARTLAMKGYGVEVLHQFVARAGQLFKDTPPQPGDLIFFSNTYDRNQDGLLNDRLTHIGMVERVSRSGTVTFLHHLGRRVTRSMLNLNEKHKHRNEKGHVINSHLRRRRRTDPKGTAYLAAGLFESFGSLFPNTKDEKPSSNPEKTAPEPQDHPLGDEKIENIDPILDLDFAPPTG